MTVLVTHKKDQGKVRQRQEDNCFSHRNNANAILILSDGMGGHAGGDLASHASVTAAQAVLQAWLENSNERSPESESALEREIAPITAGEITSTKMSNLEAGLAPRYTIKIEEWIKAGEPTNTPTPDEPLVDIPQRSQVAAAIESVFSQAQQAICDIAMDATLGVNNAGCTLTVALIVDGWLHIGHIGDSRAYLYRQDHLEQLTLDHSGAMLLVNAGIITLEEARSHPESHSLYRFLGLNATELTVDIHHEKLQKGDLVFLCSDGLWGMVDDGVMAQLVARESELNDQSLNRTAAALIQKANDLGGEDNISVALAAMC